MKFAKSSQQTYLTDDHQSNKVITNVGLQIYIQLEVAKHMKKVCETKHT